MSYFQHLFIKAVMFFLNPLARVEYDRRERMTWVTE